MCNSKKGFLTDGFSEVHHPNGFLSQNLSQLIICRAANLSFFRNLVLNRNDMNLNNLESDASSDSSGDIRDEIKNFGRKASK